MGTGSTPQAAGRSNWVFTLLWVLMGLFLTGILFFFAVSTFGRVSGEEFSPDTFQSRGYVYYRIPLVGIQVSAVTYLPNTSDLARRLISEGWIVSSTRSQPRWHFVRQKTGGRVVARGNAEILVDYLGTDEDELSLLWQKWCDDHQDMAKILWPAVAELAREELYMFVPELLDCARQASDSASFQEELESCLARQYVFLAETSLSLGEQEEAIDHYTQALQHDPECLAALRGRAEAHRAAGNQEQADADEEAARALESRQDASPPPEAPAGTAADK